MSANPSHRCDGWPLQRLRKASIHLQYEIMMMMSAATASVNGTTRADDFVMNALIESFCIHARGVMSFLAPTSSVRDTDVLARRYVVDQRDWEEREKVLLNDKQWRGHLDRLNWEIAHITSHRNEVEDRRWDRRTLAGTIESELAVWFGMVDHDRVAQTFIDWWAGARGSVGESILISTVTQLAPITHVQLRTEAVGTTLSIEPKLFGSGSNLRGDF